MMEEKEIAKFFFKLGYDKRFYGVFKLNPLQNDIIISFSGDKNWLIVTSAAYGKQIRYELADFLRDVEKFHVEQNDGRRTESN